MTDGHLHIDGIGEPTITLDGVTPARGVFRPTVTCDGGLADKLGIPSQYLRRMREEHVELLDHNVNTWLGDDPTKRYLIRTLRGDGDQPGVARAMLSEKYKITDNLDVLMAVLDGIRRTGVHTQVSRCDLTEKRMYVKVRSLEVAAHAPRLLADYRSPLSGLRGADNPLVFAGFVISNSEVGHGSFSVTPQTIATSPEPATEIINDPTQPTRVRHHPRWCDPRRCITGDADPDGLHLLTLPEIKALAETLLIEYLTAAPLVAATTPTRPTAPASGRPRHRP